MHDWTKDWYTTRYVLRRWWKWLTLAFFGLLLTPFMAWSAATLENPAPGAIKSGVGLISGWICDAEVLEVSFDGGPRKFVPYGSERTDTAGVCGDTANGFGLLINYNELGDGPHTTTLYADGVVVTLVNFNVRTLGTNFLRGVVGQGTISLSNETAVHVQWEETTQGFTIVGYGTQVGDGSAGEVCTQAPVEVETECPETPTTLAVLQEDRDHMQAVLDDIVAGCVPLVDEALPGGYYTNGRHPYWGHYHCVDKAVFNVGPCVTDDIPTNIQTYYQDGGRISFIERESKPNLSPAGELIIKYDTSNTPSDKGIILNPYQGHYYGRGLGAFDKPDLREECAETINFIDLEIWEYRDSGGLLSRPYDVCYDPDTETVLLKNNRGPTEDKTLLSPYLKRFLDRIEDMVDTGHIPQPQPLRCLDRQ